MPCVYWFWSTFNIAKRLALAESLAENSGTDFATYHFLWDLKCGRKFEVVVVVSHIFVLQALQTAVLLFLAPSHTRSGPDWTAVILPWLAFQFIQPNLYKLSRMQLQEWFIMSQKEPNLHRFSWGYTGSL